MSTDEIRALERRIEDLETQITTPKLMTPRQVCDFLQISERQFYEWKRAGDSPPAIYWSERTVRYDLDAVMAWAKQKEVGQA
ncbi:putative DNA-binding transcriptional regulator AlpA [Rhodovulum iodosum]|jgi:predicted DNA-binding transcriptional regulator AlpA|uniref:DNA-binding transcriptional regulator AlpA n=1 Tax=Rhodovulum iodosum TaxID=68291 RepID=A0ABV3XT10_9RHOB|nr:helix-turn-helix domain-containing protein [Rhodovulum robiginosum]RSK39022.1 DNA-binding protein [Rhodovulum robiginosum]